METLASIAALLLVASPAAAQLAATSGQPPTSDQSGQTAASQAPATTPTTGVFCNEEMTATFLQRGERPEYRRLWIAEQLDRKRRIDIGRQRRRRQYLVDPTLWRGAAIQ
jgi:hypothetical protein